MIDGSLDMKDGIGPTAVGTGFSLTLTPSLLLQIAGVVIGALGVFYTRARIKESKLARLEAKRANDINKERLLWEQGKHASQQNATTVQTEAGNQSQADEANAEEASK